MLFNNWTTVERVVRQESAGEAKCRRHRSVVWVEAAGMIARGRRRLDRRGLFASRQPRAAAWAVEERRESIDTVMPPTCGYGSILLDPGAEMKPGVR